MDVQVRLHVETGVVWVVVSIATLRLFSALQSIRITAGLLRSA